jgi:hypothetical protein
MKCSLCTWNSSPTSTIEARRHIETFHTDTRPEVVWRDGTFLITPGKEENEDTFDVGVRYVETPPTPPTPVSNTINEVLVSLEEDTEEK